MLDDVIRRGANVVALAPLDLRNASGVDSAGAVSPIGHIEAKVVDKTMALNVTATWRLVRPVDSLLRMPDAGRATVVSSGAAYSCRALWGVYAATKASTEALVRFSVAETENLPRR